MEVHLLQLASLSIILRLTLLCSVVTHISIWKFKVLSSLMWVNGGKETHLPFPEFSSLPMSTTLQKRFSICNYVFHVCVYLWVCACECRCWRNWEEGIDSPGAGVRSLCERSVWVLGTEPRALAAGNALNHLSRHSSTKLRVSNTSLRFCTLELSLVQTCFFWFFIPKSAVNSVCFLRQNNLPLYRWKYLIYLRVGWKQCFSNSTRHLVKQGGGV